MENFKLFRNRFTYATDTIGPVMEVELRYEMGGSNFLSGNITLRGIYLSVIPVEITEHIGSQGLVYKQRTVTIGGGKSGLKTLIAPLNRKNDKKLASIAASLDYLAPQIATLSWTDKSGALRLAKDALGLAVAA